MRRQSRDASRVRVDGRGGPRHREGAGKAGCWPHPWPACRKKAGGSHHRFDRFTRPSLRDGFTAYTCSPQGPAFLPLSPVRVTRRAWHQHRDARTTRFRRPCRHALVWRTPSRPSQPASTYRDDAYAPPREAGWRHQNMISEKTKQIYFSRSVLTRRMRLMLWTKLRVRRAIKAFPLGVRGKYAARNRSTRVFRFFRPGAGGPTVTPHRGATR